MVVVKKLADDLPKFHKFRKFGGFAEIPVCAERRHLIAVVLGVRRGDD
jgi:hypothetical protein